MGRNFNDGSGGDLLEVNSAPVIGWPVTVAFWFKSTDDGGAHRMVFLGDKDRTDHYLGLQMRWDLANDPFRFFVHTHSQDSGLVDIDSTVVSGQWHFAMGTIASNGKDITAYLDTSSASDVRAVAGFNDRWDRLSIGQFRDSTPSTDGQNFIIGELGIWNVELSSTYGEILSARAPFLSVRPDDLQYYCSLAGDQLVDRIGGLTLSASGTPDQDEHPPVGRAQNPVIFPPPGVVSAPTVHPHFYTRRRMIA